MFIVDRDGVDASDPLKGCRGMKMPNPLQNIIAGASRKLLGRIFGANRIEHARLMGFLNPDAVGETRWQASAGCKPMAVAAK